MMSPWIDANEALRTEWPDPAPFPYSDKPARFRCRIGECEERFYSAEIRDEHVDRHLHMSNTPEHGTVSRYNRGCKCTPCRAANAKASYDRRQKRRVSA